MLTDSYAEPHEVTDLMLAFPADLGDLLPPFDAIPATYANFAVLLMGISLGGSICVWAFLGQRVSPIEAAAANAADIPTVGLRFHDRTKEKFAEWPERII